MRRTNEVIAVHLAQLIQEGRYRRIVPPICRHPSLTIKYDSQLQCPIFGT